MKDLDRIQRVTANYFFWQGLRLVPFGLLLIIFAFEIYEPSWWPTTAAGDAVLLLAVLVATGLFMALGSYYRKVFGQVKQKAGLHQRRERIKWLVFYPAIFVAMMVDLLLEPPVVISGAVFAASILAYWMSTGRGRHHYLPAAMIVGLTTFLPLTGLVDPGQRALAVLVFVLGLIYIIGGILDHFELARLLKPTE
jgi:hypothetical protein